MMAEVHTASITRAAENTTEIYGDAGVIIQSYGDLPSGAAQPPHPVGGRVSLEMIGASYEASET